ncbi:hypothetical protein MOB47_09280 [Bacillus inaquosorum]|uniref:hypothetical protein n=1 Tax=Bacillus inaquosorum TaxID=483913 RepID=UPI00227EABA7|nr:hypothetical protein [Bacillus inaquosorum]MCY8029674.1 hypothetical protein [Bacillus inaquosorum]MCY8493503.1 hypothetical protein [Bacillus inaquosorum]MCY8697699.1 hypothetical protein [Bacillus inaquosorum]MCY8798774.1 hypothetical protein [Bacillus inaquosorum]MCY8849332.1 hypothetical protein [Bacillus inaquosorum]
MKRILVLVIALGLALVPFASANAESTTKEIAETKNQVEKLEKDLGFELVDVSSEEFSSVSKKDFLKFDSVQDFEEFIKDAQQPQEFEEVINVSEDTPLIKPQASGSHVINWWAPFTGWGMTGMACWKNIAFNYQYKFVNKKPQFTKVSGINSYVTGLNVAWWDQTGKSYNITKKKTTNDTAKIKVVGAMVLGIDIKGFTIGAKIGQTWKGSLTLY